MPARSTDNPAPGEGALAEQSQSQNRTPPAGFAAGAWLAQNSRLGFAARNRHLHQAIALSKPLIAPGLPDPLYDFRVGPRCSSKERDSETGLDYFGARYLSSAQGRFTSPDPTFLNILKVVNPQRWNLYGYALNNPLKFVDPDGEEATAIRYPGYQVGVHGKFTLPLGHAGVVMVDRDGSTHYFEYGRYPHNDNVPGVVRNAGASDTPTPAVDRDASGQITPESMEKLLATLSQAAGHGGAVDALVFDTATIEDEVMLAHLRELQRQNNDPNREPYSIWSHNCGTLMCEAFDRAGHPAPNHFIRWGATPGGLFDMMEVTSGASQRVSYVPKKKKEKVTSRICYEAGGCQQ